MSATRGARSKKLSLKQQISLVFCCGLVMLILISTVLLATITNRTLSEHAQRQGQIIAASLAQESALAFLYDSEDIAEKTAQATLAFPSVQHIVLYRPNHEVFYQTGELLPSGVNYEGDAQVREDDEAWFFSQPVVAATEEASDSPFAGEDAQEEVLGSVVVTMSKQSLHDMASRIFLSNATVIGGVSLLMLTIILMVTQRLTRPLQNLIAIMKKAQAGQLGVRAGSCGPADIVIMEKAFNQMMEEIEDREAELIVTRDAALESARIKATFAATVSHELRTPMNGVLGMLQLIATTDLSEKAQGFTRTAMSSAADLLRLIDDVLDFSKVESGKIVLNEEEVSLRVLGDDIVELLGAQARQKQLLLACIVDEDVPDQVLADSVRLRQVLVNLIGNAIKFTHEGYILLQVSEERSIIPPMLVFTVTDTGIGISQDAQRRIFDSFVQADGSTTRRYGGTGLGLTISKQLVELMGGTLAVSSEEGVGTTFSFNVPRVVDEGQGSYLPPLKKFALVVSDQNARLNVLLRTLGGWHYSVQGYTQLESAIVELANDHTPTNRYDLILLDVAFPTRKECDFFFDYAKRTNIPVVCLRESQSLPHRVQSTFSFLPEFSDSTTLKKRLIEVQPALEATAPDAADHDASGHQHLNLLILVVDDNLTNQMVAKDMLEFLGFSVQIADNGQVALDMLEKSASVVAVLMDCHMPVMDGYEATQRYRERETGLNRMPILAMTAHTSSDDRQRCLDAGMDDHISKPIISSELESKLSRWIPQYAGQGISEQSATGDDTGILKNG